MTEYNFEQALKQLQQQIEALEKQPGLEKSLEIYEKGMTLVKQCEQQLEQAKQKIEQIQRGKDGSPQVDDSGTLQNDG